VSSFLAAHQHTAGYLTLYSGAEVPEDDEIVQKSNKKIKAMYLR